MADPLHPTERGDRHRLLMNILERVDALEDEQAVPDASSAAPFAHSDAIGNVIAQELADIWWDLYVLRRSVGLEDAPRRDEPPLVSPTSAPSATYYALVLNPMTARTETVEMICWCEQKEPLEQLLERERVETYRDNTWNKCFRKDGPLEWFNPPDRDTGVVEIAPSGPHITELP